MEFTPQQVGDFNVALNEATLLGIDLKPSQRSAALAFAVLALPPDDGPPPADPTVVILLQPVGRLAVSYRLGRWDDADALVEPLELDRLPEVLDSLEPQAVYGWRFLDVPEEDDFANWSDRLSLDWRSQPGGMRHTLDLFQEPEAGCDERHLDMRIWFDELEVFGPPDRRRVPFDDFTAAGVRWWDGLYAGDERTAGVGIVPLRSEQQESQGP